MNNVGPSGRRMSEGWDITRDLEVLSKKINHILPICESPTRPAWEIYPIRQVIRLGYGVYEVVVVAVVDQRAPKHEHSLDFGSVMATAAQ
nr:hypothetical protein Iba_chr13aCG7160 [Ipomoea batatas]